MFWSPSACFTWVWIGRGWGYDWLSLSTPKYPHKALCSCAVLFDPTTLWGGDNYYYLSDQKTKLREVKPAAQDELLQICACRPGIETRLYPTPEPEVLNPLAEALVLAGSFITS